MSAKTASPRSGTQAIAAKGSNDPVTEEGKPIANVTLDQMGKHIVGINGAFIHASLMLVVAGACYYVIGIDNGQKRDDIETALRKLVSERGVQKTQSWQMMTTAWQLAQRVAQTGKKAFPQSRAYAAALRNANTPEEAVTGLLASLKTDHSVTSFNTLRVLCDIETEWTAKAAADAAAAAKKRSTPAYKKKRERVKTENAVNTVANAGSDVLAVTMARVAKKDDDTALKAVLAAIGAMSDRDQLAAIRDTATDRLNVIGVQLGHKPAPVANKATQPTVN